MRTKLNLLLVDVVVSTTSALTRSNLSLPSQDCSTLHPGQGRKLCLVKVCKVCSDQTASARKYFTTASAEPPAARRTVWEGSTSTSSNSSALISDTPPGLRSKTETHSLLLSLRCSQWEVEDIVEEEKFDNTTEKSPQCLEYTEDLTRPKILQFVKTDLEY